MKRKIKLLRLVMLCMLMLFSASEMWATEMTVNVKCEPTGVAKVYEKFETEEEYTENQGTVLNPQDSGNFNLKYDNLQEGYTFLGWSKGAPSTKASDMVSTDQVATVTVPKSEPTVTYYANFSDGSNFTITEDGSISEHGTVTYKVQDKVDAEKITENAKGANEGDLVTMTITPDEGYVVGSVTANAYATWEAAGARRKAPAAIPMLGDVTLTPVEGKANTWTFTMPAANVQVSATYIPVAAFAPAEPSGTLAPTAAEGVIAGEDKAIIVAGTVANIPETTNPQGTVKYFVTDNKDMTAEQAAKANGWVEALPTAAGYTGSYADDFQVYVWYYIQAATGYADSEPQRIEVTVLSNLFDLTLNAANAYTIDATQTSKGTVSVKEGTGAAVDKTSAITDEGKLTAIKMGSEVKMTAKQGYKFRKVEVKKKVLTALNITSPVVGQVIGSDGKNYAYASLPTGVTAVAKICYVSGSNGLALALTDEEGEMNWSTAQTTCAAHTPAFTGGTWKLATKDEWSNMISTAGSHDNLRDGFSSVGGTNMQAEGYYWSSTESDADRAWGCYFNDGVWDDNVKGGNLSVRACLAF